MRTLSSAAHTILNDPARIFRRDLWFSRMGNLFAGTSDCYNDQHIFTLLGSVPRPADDNLAYTDPEEWILQCLELIAGQPECTDDRFAPVCVEYPIYGVHFIDRIFGAEVYQDSGQWYNHYLTTPIGSLQMPDLDQDETWSLAKRAAMAFLEADVQLPLFGLPTLSSALNILVNLYGGNSLAAMIEDEDNVLHDLTIINDVIRSLHRWYLDNIPHQQLQPVISWGRTQPPEFGQLCGCTTQLLSGRMYSNLIAPLDDALLAEYPHGGMIHLCGAHAQHISVFREMPHLRAIQLNDRAAADLKLYFQGLREDQIIYLNPCDEMTTEQAIAITRGHRLVLCQDGNAPKKA